MPGSSTLAHFQPENVFSTCLLFHTLRNAFFHSHFSTVFPLFHIFPSPGSLRQFFSVELVENSPHSLPPLAESAVLSTRKGTGRRALFQCSGSVGHTPPFPGKRLLPLNSPRFILTFVRTTSIFRPKPYGKHENL